MELKGERKKGEAEKKRGGKVVFFFSFFFSDFDFFYFTWREYVRKMWMTPYCRTRLILYNLIDIDLHTANYILSDYVLFIISI